MTRKGAINHRLILQVTLQFGSCLRSAPNVQIIFKMRKLTSATSSTEVYTSNKIIILLVTLRITHNKGMKIGIQLDTRIKFALVDANSPDSDQTCQTERIRCPLQ